MYTVKGVKTFRGMDTHGYNATLYRGKKKVAFLIEEGNGGELNINWADWQQPRVPISTFGHDGTEYKWNGTPEEELLYAHVRARSKDDHRIDKSEVDMFLAGLVDDFENDKRFKKMCKTKTLFRVKGDPEGEWRVISHPFGEKVREFLEKTHGDKLEEVMNTREGYQ